MLHEDRDAAGFSNFRRSIPLYLVSGYCGLFLGNANGAGESVPDNFFIGTAMVVVGTYVINTTFRLKRYYDGVNTRRKKLEESEASGTGKITPPLIRSLDRMAGDDAIQDITESGKLTAAFLVGCYLAGYAWSALVR